MTDAEKAKKAMLPAALIILLAAAIMLTDTQAAGSRLQTIASYNTQSPFDQNDDGTERITGAIDFTVKDTVTTGLDKPKLCTWWSVYSKDKNTQSSSCTGPNECCKLLGMESSSPEWNDTFYLYYGKSNAGLKNTVSTNVAYMDYSLSDTPAYTAYGGWQTLQANFVQATITLNTTNITIESPDNTTPLTTGQSVHLNFTASTSIANTINYTFLGKSFSAQPKQAQQGTIFSETLQGSLPNSIIPNGRHNITINITANGTTETTTHTFEVNDTSPPQTTTTIQQEYTQEQGEINLTVTSAEYANITYKTNSNQPKTATANDTATITIQPVNGTNTLEINATDMQGNSNTTLHRLNFSQNMSKHFTAATDKQAYNTSEQILILITAPLNSTYSITITGPGYSQATAFSSIGPVTYFFQLQEPGNYTINASFENKATNTQKTITLPIQVTRNTKTSIIPNAWANTTVTDEGMPILFNATATGNTSALTYKWDLDADGTTDSTSQAATYTYSRNGTYNAALNISDGTSNATATITITVRRLNNITITATDNQTGTPIENATITIDGKQYNTSSTGTTTAKKHAGTYDIETAAEGYYTRLSQVSADQNTTLTISLQRIPSKTLNITITSLTTNRSAMELRYTPYGEDMQCTAHLNTTGTWQELKKEQARNGTELTATAQNLSEGTHYTRITCTDQQGTQNSTTKDFTINLTQSILPKTEEITALINEIERIKTEQDDETRDSFQLLNLNKEVDNAKTNLERYRRDLYDLPWRRLPKEEEENTTQRIMSAVNSVKNATPISAKTKDEKEYVTYPKRSTVDEAVAKLLQRTRKRISEDERKSFVQKNLDLQSRLTTTTKAKHIEVLYMTGERSIYTYVEKELSLNDNSTETILLESIPKDIAEDINQIEFITEQETFEPDPIAQIDKTEKAISYYIKKNIPLEKTKETTTLLLYSEYTPPKTNAITGLLVKAGLEDLAKTAKKRLIAEIIVIMLLATVYLAYSRKTNTNPKVKQLIKEAEEALQKNDYDAAKKAYTEIRSLYPGLPEKTRQSLREQTTILCSSINACYAKNRAEAAKKLVAEGSISEAKDAYKAISAIYSTITGQKKQEVYLQCQELHKLLTAAQGMKKT
ncbi:PKD domain-containing protein [Candidatus Woesearchaeota archaeon]|nr:PKD domain-containing protein [Candidatus Woesearchaeota archaeon]